MKHTPGPWSVSKLATPEHSPEFAVYADGSPRDIARVIGGNSEADAALIAAAPKMLAALEALFRECVMIHTRYGEFCNRKEADAAIKAGLDAIAEAKGE